MSANAALQLLLAEDDEDDVYLFKQAIEDAKLPIEVCVAGEVREAVNLLETFVPGVVVIDVILPPSNGVELLKIIRSNRKLKQVPIIMFSTSESNKFVEASLKAGASLYLTKPDSYSELLQIVKRIYETSTNNVALA